MILLNLSSNNATNALLRSLYAWLQNMDRIKTILIFPYDPLLISKRRYNAFCGARKDHILRLYDWITTCEANKNIQQVTVQKHFGCCAVSEFGGKFRWYIIIDFNHKATIGLLNKMLGHIDKARGRNAFPILTKHDI